MLLRVKWMGLMIKITKHAERYRRRGPPLPVPSGFRGLHLIVLSLCFSSMLTPTGSQDAAAVDSTGQLLGVKKDECAVDTLGNVRRVFTDLGLNVDCRSAPFKPTCPSQVAVGFTTCKRPRLFARAVQSFVLRCLDCDKLVSAWLAVDDGSSADELAYMRAKVRF